jgi:hypothetical protein
MGLVIASEAKQSFSRRDIFRYFAAAEGLLRRFAPRNDARLNGRGLVVTQSNEYRHSTRERPSDGAVTP